MARRAAALRDVLGDIQAGSSITRALLNERVRSHVLTGRVLDVGSLDVGVEEVGRGPFAANCVNVMFALPRALRPALVAWYWALDAAYLALRPEARVRYPLGYLFSARR